MLFLIQDGITNGAIYALLGLALVLVFAVTRVILIPQGEFVTYGALTYASLMSGQMPGTAKLALAMGVAAFAFDLYADAARAALAEDRTRLRGQCRITRRRARPDCLGGEPPRTDSGRGVAVAGDRGLDRPVPLSPRLPAPGAYLGAGAADRLGRLALRDAGTGLAVLRRRRAARTAARRRRAHRRRATLHRPELSRSMPRPSPSSSRYGCSSVSRYTARRCAPPPSTGSARGSPASALRCRDRSPSCSPP